MPNLCGQTPSPLHTTQPTAVGADFLPCPLLSTFAQLIRYAIAGFQRGVQADDGIGHRAVRGREDQTEVNILRVTGCAQEQRQALAARLKRQIELGVQIR